MLGLRPLLNSIKLKRAGQCPQTMKWMSETCSRLGLELNWIHDQAGSSPECYLGTRASAQYWWRITSQKLREKQWLYGYPFINVCFQIALMRLNMHTVTTQHLTLWKLHLQSIIMSSSKTTWEGQAFHQLPNMWCNLDCLCWVEYGDNQLCYCSNDLINGSHNIPLLTLSLYRNKSTVGLNSAVKIYWCHW